MSISEKGSEACKEYIRALIERNYEIRVHLGEMSLSQADIYAGIELSKAEQHLRKLLGIYEEAKGEQEPLAEKIRCLLERYNEMLSDLLELYVGDYPVELDKAREIICRADIRELIRKLKIT